MLHLQTHEQDGGLFVFQLPTDWQHAIEDDGTQVFWDEAAGSGTLRVSSLTAMKRSSLEASPQLAFLAGRGEPKLREDGVAWCHHSRAAEENDQPTTTFWWEFAHFIPPCFGRLAFFSFTIYTHELSDPSTASQLRHLQSLVKSVKFGPVQKFEHAASERDA